jgi:hypothetical protein
VPFLCLTERLFRQLVGRVVEEVPTDLLQGPLLVKVPHRVLYHVNEHPVSPPSKALEVLQLLSFAKLSDEAGMLLSIGVQGNHVGRQGFAAIGKVQDGNKGRVTGKYPAIRGRNVIAGEVIFEEASIPLLTLPKRGLRPLIFMEERDLGCGVGQLPSEFADFLQELISALRGHDVPLGGEFCGAQELV